MSEDKKSKKNGVEKLRIVLDNPSTKNLHPEDEKHLIALKKRLDKKSHQKVIIKKSVDVQYSTQDADPLKPKVIIHYRKEKTIVSEPKVEFEEMKEESKESAPVFEEVKAEEDLIEINKVEIKEPEFIEVKPKQVEKEEAEPKKEDLPEWQPVEEEQKEESFIEVEKVEVKEIKEEPVEFQPVIKSEEEEVDLLDNDCPRCNAKIHTDDKFCQNCGYNLQEEQKEEEKKETPVFTPVEEKEEQKEKDVEWEQSETSSALIEAESKEIVAQDEPEVETVEEEVEVLEKIDVFDEIESIDDETAKNLYKSGFTSIDSLTIATVKDIAKTPGIKKRKAKQIKKEIDKKSKEIQGYKPPETSESQEVEITEEQIENIEDSVQLEEKTLAFSELDSVDSETAVLLYDNGCTTVDSLKNKTIKDLCKIKGIKKKKAKKIVAEIDKKIEESLNVKPINIDETAEGEVSEEQIKNDTDFKEEKSKLNPVELSSTDAEWNPVQEDVELQEEKPSHDGEAEEKESIDEKYEKIEDLKEIINIDDDTAVVLYDAGYKTIESLRDVKVKDLTKIKIKKKRAKAIIKDIEEHFKIFESNDSMIKEDDEEYFLEDDDEGEALEIEDKIKEFQEPTAEVVEEEFAEELVEDVPEIEVEEERDDVFKEISSIDKKISDLLLNNGVDTLEKLNEKTIKELTKIKGIRKKVAKQIKKDVEKYLNMNNEEEESYDNVNDNPYLADEDDEWETFDEKSGKSEAYMHGEYTLYEKEITTKSGNQRLVRFFSKGQPDDAEPIDIPDGFEVIENKKTGVPYLRKIK